MPETTQQRPVDVLRDLAAELAHERELAHEIEATQAKINDMADRLGFLATDGPRYFRVPVYRSYVHTTEVVAIEREAGPSGIVVASLVPASDPGSLEWPESEPKGHTVNPHVNPTDLAAQIAAVMQDGAA